MMRAPQTRITSYNVCYTKLLRMDTDPYVMAAMIFGTVVGPLESLTYREEPLQDLEKLKQEIVRFLDKSILKQQERSL